MKKLILIFSILVLFTQTISAQKNTALSRVEPSFWWVGFKHQQLQLVVYGQQIAQRNVSINHEGVTLEQVVKVENPNYLFINLKISATTQPGIFKILFQKNGEKDLVYNYELKARNTQKIAQGVTDKDLIYLIMPDRFANGNYANDKIAGLNDQTFNRDSMYYRHGGDIEGIINHLDYIKDLGATTIWLTPVLANNEFKTSYHGYANTENYTIEPRYGTNAIYKKLVDEAHAKDLKIIMDVVPNHVGSQHWTVLDKPFKDWVHQWQGFTRTTYKDQTIFDPYASAEDKKIMQNGWFDYHMPDMNQENELVQNYILQSYLFWIEYAGVDGFRIDTYPYNNLDFMAMWMKRVKDEYSNFTMFGETMVHGLVNQSYFTQGKTVNQNQETELLGVTDFQIEYGIKNSLNQNFGWTEGVNNLYSVLASDFIYQNPNRNVLQLDNHDITRFFTTVGEDLTKFKSGMAMLLTIRGIPQIYYGTELLFKGSNNPDGLLRADVLGGWKEDTVNKFTAAGRTAQENEAFNYIKALANYRKNTSALQSGKTMQFVPIDGIYVYFRYDDAKTVMVVYNSNMESKTVTLNRFKERTTGFNKAKEITSGRMLENLESVVVPQKTAYIFELKK
jgi:glycosidase